MASTPLPDSAPASAFAPLHQSARAPSASRPSQSYWQDAWRRLKANRRAMASLVIIAALGAFTLVGPLLWPVDPALQDVQQISHPPGANRNVTIVPPYSRWPGPETPSPKSTSTTLSLAAPATTPSVRLSWAPIAGAQAYTIYRNIVPVSPGQARGVPLATTEAVNTTHYEDRMDLKARTTFYTVVPQSSSGQDLPGQQTLEVTPTSAITRDEAIERGMIAADAPLRVGESIKYRLHPLGTDYLGRDMLARLMQGARVSLFIGVAAPLLFVLFGTVFGAVAGFIGGRIDALLMRFADFVIALPFLLFMILFKIAFGIGPGESGIIPMIIALVILSWPGTARLVRGQILQVREEAYVSAARLLGARTPYLVLRHMIPNTLGVILVTLTFAIPSAIFTEAFLSFIGMGVAPPTASWGSMSNDGIKTMLSTPHELALPALFISITVLAFNLLGDGLRDALDARMRSRE
jgi:oligopeptide transport system permease protein